MSSFLKSTLPACGALNGNTSNEYCGREFSHPNCFHTAIDDYWPWWRVDLLYVYTISVLKLYRRSQAINTELDAQPSYEEVNKAIKQMTTGKAPGPDAIPAEVYKTGGEIIRNQLTSLFQSMWKQEHLPQEFRDATIVHIYKRKGNRQSCDNH
ncbi:hypothetical protein ACOMHN_037531 [Nucella lapillus]